MREFKFRVYDKKTNEMIFMESIFNEKPYTETSTFPQYESFPKYHDVEIMQFTGRKDKSGTKEIYEGDILKVYEFMFYVLFHDGCYVCKERIESDWIFPLKKISELSEIIGNIHENPELLEDK